MVLTEYARSLLPHVLLGDLADEPRPGNDDPRQVIYDRALKLLAAIN